MTRRGVVSLLAVLVLIVWRVEGQYISAPVTAGKYPESVAIADFNSDGKVDLVTANNADSNFGLLLGRGDGTFQSQTTFSTQGSPTFVLAADFNGDSNQDLAVAQYGNESVIQVFLGNGRGGFNYGVNLTAEFPNWIVGIDLNGDGNLDLVSTNRYGSTVTVALGDGSGKFPNPEDFITSTGGNPGPFCVQVGDITGDQVLDLVVSNYEEGTLSVLKGNGRGVFSAPDTYDVSEFPTTLSLNDINKDGRLDVVLGYYSGSAVGILLNTGNTIRFVNQTLLTVGTLPLGVNTYDLNSDTFIDIITSNYGDNSISVFYGNHSSTFTKGYSVSTGSATPFYVVLADANKDSALDIFAGSDNSNTVTLLLSNQNSVSTTTPQPGSSNDRTYLAPVIVTSIVLGVLFIIVIVLAVLR